LLDSGPGFHPDRLHSTGMTVVGFGGREKKEIRLGNEIKLDTKKALA